MDLLSKLNFSDLPAVASLAGLGGIAVVTFAGVFLGRGTKESSTFSNPEPPVSSGKKLVRAVKFFTCPVVTVAGVWSLVEHPAAFIAAVPGIFKGYADAALRTVMPVHPTNFHEAFQLGQIYESIQKLIADGASESAKSVQELLKKAAEIAGRAVSLEDLMAVPKELLLMSQQRSITDRILSAFSLVNLIWFVSIIGLTVTLGPFLWYLATPLKNILTKLWNKVIYPTIIALKPFYEPIAYAISFYLMIESARYPLHDKYQMSGVMTAITGLAGFALSWVYTTHLNSTNDGNFELWAVITSLLMVGASAPLAALHQSKLIGYITVISLISGLGFSVFSTRFCLFLGWDNYNAMARSTAACFILALMNASARALQIDDSPWILPFSSAVNCFATTVYFLGMNILTASARTNVNAYTVAYVVNLIAFGVMGTVLNLDGMANSAKAWGVILGLVLMGKNPPNSGVFIVWLFSFFATLYGASLYISRHPAVMAAIFAGL